MDTNSNNYYDSTADNYAGISFLRRNYLNAVDRIIIDNLRDIKAERLLDIGAGDGRRSRRLADALGVKQITVIESSVKMASEAKKQLCDGNVILGDILELDLPEAYFDVVISLWNVFGHFSSKEHRIGVLKKISKIMKPAGKCIIDVNNRYNSRHYGWLTVFRNVFDDFRRKKNSGWFSLQMNGVEGKVYLHRPLEFSNYLSNINLKIVKKYYVDYTSGTLRKMPWDGQCVYVLSHIESNRSSSCRLQND